VKIRSKGQKVGNCAFVIPAQSKEKENKTDGKFLFVIICIIVLVFTYLLT
jgi:hypothetical protein